MKLKDLKKLFHKALDLIYGKDEVESLFFLCAEHYLDFSRIQMALQPNFTIGKTEHETIFNVLHQLKLQKPIQYIIGETEFYGLKFKVNKNVLIPRQETEELVDWIIKTHQPNSKNQNPITILDIGTGSGCIAISLVKHLPNAKVYALDVSEKALGVAKENATINNVDIRCVHSDILNPNGYREFVSERHKYDIIVSNPPYVRQLEKTEMKPNVLDNEPHLALFVEDDNALVFYKAITNFAIHNLRPKGSLYFEINQYLGEATKQLLVNAHFNDIELRKDLNGNNRMLKGIKNCDIPTKVGI